MVFFSDALRGIAMGPPMAADNVTAPAAFTNSRRVYFFEACLFHPVPPFQFEGIRINWGQEKYRSPRYQSGLLGC